MNQLIFSSTASLSVMGHCPRQFNFAYSVMGNEMNLGGLFSLWWSIIMFIDAAEAFRPKKKVTKALFFCLFGDL